MGASYSKLFYVLGKTWVDYETESEHIFVWTPDDCLLYPRCMEGSLLARMMRRNLPWFLVQRETTTIGQLQALGVYCDIDSCVLVVVLCWVCLFLGTLLGVVFKGN